MHVSTVEEGTACHYIFGGILNGIWKSILNKHHHKQWQWYENNQHVLECVSVIINYMATYTIVMRGEETTDEFPHPPGAVQQQEYHPMDKPALHTLTDQACHWMFLLCPSHRFTTWHQCWLVGDHQEKSCQQDIMPAMQCLSQYEHTSPLFHYLHWYISVFFTADSLQMIRPDQQDALLSIAHIADKEMSQSKWDSAVERLRAQQAFCIQYLMGLGLDPCNKYKGYMVVLSIFVRSLYSHTVFETRIIFGKIQSSSMWRNQTHFTTFMA